MRYTKRGHSLCVLAVILLYFCGYVDAGRVAGVVTNNDFNLAILVPYTGSWAVGPKMASAAGLGVQEVMDRGILPAGYSIDWDWVDTQCIPSVGLSGVIDLWRASDDVDAWIGGGCSEVCKIVAHIASAMDMPYVSFGCTEEELSKKKNFPTFFRTVGTWSNLAPAFPNFAQYFESHNWNRFRIIATTEQIMMLTANAIKTAFENAGFADQTTLGVSTVESTIVTADDEVVETDAELKNAMKEKLRSLKDETRIFILLMHDQDIRNALVLAKDLDMTNGDYTFITLDASLPADVDYERHAPSPSEAEQAYEGLISFNLGIDPNNAEWQTFAQRVIDEFKIEPKFRDYDYLGKDGPADVSEVDVHAGMLHDAILTWAYGVALSYAGGNSVDGGEAITQALINDTDGIQGVTGLLKIDDEGNRNPDYNVEIIQSGTYVPLMSWKAETHQIQKVYKLDSPTDWSGITWMGSQTSVPSGQPDCGWRGELCVDNTTTVIMIAVPVTIVALIIIAGVAFFFINRHLKFEAELKSVAAWKVDWNDIKKSKQADQVEQSRATLHSNKTYQSLAGGKQVFCDVASYKGKIVAIKKINKPCVNIQERAILIELKNMRDMNHENINQFVGACPDAPNVSILMLYGQKGSLQDVLQNENINLTWDFKISLSTDIIKGLGYIHQSPFGSHGHLTSSNCVIDSRWTCKLTDYGMYLFKSGAEKDEENEWKEAANRLWTAPEILNGGGGRYGSKEGDIFSYSIIVSEILTKDAPYSHNGEIEPSEIINRVASGSGYRPVIPQDCCGALWMDMMIECWAEDPTARPNSQRVVTMLRKINGGKQINVVDNMIKILENYAEHLEEIVAERTAELTLEKKKVETLLYNILPKSVADALTAGRTVEPERYEQVTIYFSDIVGFSKLSADSSPVQIVEMLNTLYSTFDDVTDKYDVYKVETINDAYMVSSGVPERNGQLHAIEICTMALHLLSAVSNYKIPHLPNRMCQLRIGIHTGACVAGVVGLKMPRYCLFGDTVNTSSRMQSNSMALRIHMSSFTADILIAHGGFHLDCRGEIPVKGKGTMRTYWLDGKDGFSLPLPDLSLAVGLEEHEFK